MSNRQGTTDDANDIEDVESATVRGAQWRSRLDGLVPDGVGRRRVAVLGCGSVGSFIASELVRAGVRDILLVDPDRVEWPNLTRTVYGHRDVGRPKVEALSDHLRSIFADVRVMAHHMSIQMLGPTLSDSFSNVSLVVSAVDEPPATGFINRHCYALGIPAMFVALYQGAKGGEVIISIPNRTPCFHCSTGGLRRMSQDVGLSSVSRSRRDYGTNRLVAEVALGSDIHFVSCAALKIAVSILCGDEPPSELGNFVRRQLGESCNYVIFGMTPDYFLFPSSHGTAMGQYAFQSLWAATSSHSECEVCGLEENRAAIAPVSLA